MKHLIILLSFLSWFISIFAQQDTSITVKGYKTQGQGKIFVKRDTTITVRGYKIQTQNFKVDTFKLNGQRQRISREYNVEGLGVSSDNFEAFKNTDTLSKEISIEVECKPDATVFIENIYRRLVIKTSPDNKVKITTSINYSLDDSNLTDEERFQQLNLELKSNNNQVVLKSNNLNDGMGINKITITGQTASSSRTILQHLNFDNVNQHLNMNTVAVLDGNGNWTNKKSNTYQILTVFIPANTKLDVESKYADVEIQNDIKSIKADITNASLRFMNVETADIQSKYGRINAGNIKKADIELTNGKFYAKDIYSAKFDSKYSNIEFGVSNDLKIESINDQYEIDEVTDLKANKNYGNLRITNLKNSFNLTGNNADIKVRNITAELNNIKIDDKYADIRLPLNNIINYSVDFDGKNCNVYAPFEKIVVLKIEEAKPKDSQLKEPPPAKQTEDVRVTGFKTLSPLTINKINFMEAKDNAFKATVGDIKGKHAELQFKCTNCTVDFK